MMQEQLIRKILEMVLEIVERENQRVLFLLTRSDTDEEVLLENLLSLTQKYPNSRICMDSEGWGTWRKIANHPECKKRFAETAENIHQEVLSADRIAAVSFEPAAIAKTAGLFSDTNVTRAVMEALAQGKTVWAAEDDLKEQLEKAKTPYRNAFEDAKKKTEAYGIRYISRSQIAEALAGRLSITEDTKKTKPCPGSKKRQLVTVEDLAKNPDLEIREDAIVTPAAKEILERRRQKGRR